MNIWKRPGCWRPRSPGRRSRLLPKRMIRETGATLITDERVKVINDKHDQEKKERGKR